MKTTEEWKAHWNAKTATDPVELNGYCINGVPIPADVYRAAVIEPTLTLLELQPHHRVLDLGCGSGVMLAEIEERVAEASGTDISATMAAKFQGRSLIHVCAADQLPFSAASFDRILMLSVAIYFPDFEYFSTVIEKCVSLLRDKGILVIGDLLLGPQKGDGYLSIDPKRLFDFLSSKDWCWRIQSQNRAKRRINRRWDLVVFRD